LIALRGVVQKSELSLLIVSALIVSFPIAFNIFAGVRLVDCILVFSFVTMWALCTPKWTNASRLFLVFYLFFFLSIFNGLIRLGIQDLRNLFFFYKYAVVFLAVWICTYAPLSEQQIRSLLKLYFWIFVLLVVHVYLHIWLTVAGVLPGGFRPSMPFNNEYLSQASGTSDAHLYSAYLSMSLCAFFALLKVGYFKLHWVWVVVLTAACCGALILTGSRTGIVTLVVTTLFAGTFLVIRFLINPTYRMRRGMAYGLVAGILLILMGWQITRMLNLDEAFVERVSKLFERAINFELSSDASTLARMVKLSRALEVVLNAGILLGVGMQSVRDVFYDSAVAAILVSSGVLGLIAFCSVIGFFSLEVFKNALAHRRRPELFCFAIVLGNYVLANLFTEYFLVSRSAVPFAILVGLLVNLIRKDAPSEEPAVD